MGRAEQNIDERKLSSWKLLDEFRRRLAKVQARTPKPQARPGGPERLLLEEDYFSLVLFGLFNPVMIKEQAFCHGSCKSDASFPRRNLRCDQKQEARQHRIGFAARVLLGPLYRFHACVATFPSCVVHDARSSLIAAEVNSLRN